MLDRPGNVDVAGALGERFTANSGIDAGVQAQFESVDGDAIADTVLAPTPAPTATPPSTHRPTATPKSTPRPAATPTPPRAASQLIRHGSRASHEVALTFDMGGRVGDALAIVDWLVDHQVHATIFMTGAMADNPNTDAGRQALVADLGRGQRPEVSVGVRMIAECEQLGPRSAASRYAESPPVHTPANAGVWVMRTIGSMTSPNDMPPTGASS